MELHRRRQGLITVLYPGLQGWRSEFRANRSSAPGSSAPPSRCWRWPGRSASAAAPPWLRPCCSSPAHSPSSPGGRRSPGSSATRLATCAARRPSSPDRKPHSAPRSAQFALDRQPAPDRTRSRHATGRPRSPRPTARHRSRPLFLRDAVAVARVPVRLDAPLRARCPARVGGARYCARAVATPAAAALRLGPRHGLPDLYRRRGPRCPLTAPAGRMGVMNRPGNSGDPGRLRPVGLASTASSSNWSANSLRASPWFCLVQRRPARPAGSINGTHGVASKYVRFRGLPVLYTPRPRFESWLPYQHPRRVTDRTPQGVKTRTEPILLFAQRGPQRRDPTRGARHTDASRRALAPAVTRCGTGVAEWNS